VYRGEESPGISSLLGRAQNKFFGGAVAAAGARMDTAGLFVGVLEVNPNNILFG